ncbi:hypothetical protein Q9Q99_02975 [Curtobacterium flaccumfaciens]|nr:hypothetical protein Q9Q99_02975 [Curtobacterium flaccumfaciens]
MRTAGCPGRRPAARHRPGAGVGGAVGDRDRTPDRRHPARRVPR